MGLDRRACWRSLTALAALCVGTAASQSAGVELAEGDIVLSDPGNGAVLRFQPSTGALDVIASADVGRGPINDMGRPRDVALGPDGIYSHSGQFVHRIDPATGDRTLVATIQGGARIEQSPHDRALYEVGTGGLVRVDPDGSSQSYPAVGLQFGGNLAVTRDAVWVTGVGGEGFASSVWRFPLDGGEPVEWAHYAGLNFRLIDVTVDAVGDMHFLGSNGAVLRPDPSSPASRLEVVSDATHPGPVLLDAAAGIGPEGMVLDIDGTLLVTTRGRPGRLLRVDPVTGERELLLEVANPNGLGLGDLFAVPPRQLREGDIILSDPEGAAILRFQRSSGVLEVIMSRTVGSGPDPGVAEEVADVALGPDDALYTRRLRIDPGTGDRELRQTGAPLEHSRYDRALYRLGPNAPIRLNPDGSSQPFPPVPVFARAFAAAPDGLWMVGSNSNEITVWRFPLDLSTPVQTARYAPLFLEAKDFVVTPSGEKFVLESGSIVRLLPSTTQVVSGPNQGPPLFDFSKGIFAGGMALDTDGSLLVTTRGFPGRLMRVDTVTGNRELLLELPNRGFGDFFVVSATEAQRDSDADGLVDGLDNCPEVRNLDQLDRDDNGVGDACNAAEDPEGDEYENEQDNCPDVANPDQADLDRNGTGDACNDFEDPDGDDLAGSKDNCPDVANPDQKDFDRNGVGDACNDFEDRDGDELADGLDGCPDDFDPTRTDTDGDRVEDACDPFPLEPDNEKGQLGVDLIAALAALEETQSALAICMAHRVFQDEDQDGEEDSTDGCPGTPAREAVDDAGCSQHEFCSRISIQGLGDRLRCLRADWLQRSAEPASGRDCAVARSDAAPFSLSCVAQ